LIQQFILFSMIVWTQIIVFDRLVQVWENFLIIVWSWVRVVDPMIIWSRGTIKPFDLSLQKIPMIVWYRRVLLGRLVFYKFFENLILFDQVKVSIIVWYRLNTCNKYHCKKLCLNFFFFGNKNKLGFCRVVYDLWTREKFCWNPSGS